MRLPSRTMLALVAILSVSCGRLGFEVLGTDGPGGDGASTGDRAGDGHAGASDGGGGGGDPTGDAATSPDAGGGSGGSDAGGSGSGDAALSDPDAGPVTIDPACAAPVVLDAPLPAHRYAFEGTSGATLTDSTGGSAATVQGGAALDGSGILRLDGTNDYVALPTGLISGASGLTVMLWVQWDSGPQRQSMIELGSTDGGGNVLTRIGLLVSEPGRGLTLHVETGSQSITASAIPTLSITGIHQVAFDIDPPQGRLAVYLNGDMLVEQFETPFALSDVDVSEAYLGRPLSSADAYFRGRYAEARFYDRALGPCAIAGAHASGSDATGFARCAAPEDNCTFRRDGASGVWICPTIRDWISARDLCAASGNWLVSIEGSAENTALGQATAQSIWTGLNDRTSEGSHLWCGASTPTYYAWASGQPAGAGADDCVVRDGATGLWREEPCGALYAYACEP